MKKTITILSLSIFTILILGAGCEVPSEVTDTQNLPLADEGGLTDEAIEDIENFVDCILAGYPVMESHPRQCAVPGGDTFTEILEEPLPEPTPTPTPTPSPTPEPTPTPTPAPQPASGITLSAKAVSNGVELSWSVSGVNIDQGFKLVKSESANPVYPGDSYQYLSNSSARAYTWSLQDGKTYNFRVCKYIGSACGVYSNNVQATAPQKETNQNNNNSGSVSSISLSSSGNNSVSWTTVGTSDQGFKIVWSKSTNPVYPNRNQDRYIYTGDQNATSATLNAFDGSGTYYVRVCEYIGSACGVYSNEIVVEL